MVLVDWQVDIDSQFIQEPTKAIIQTKSKGTSHWNIESWCTNEGFGMYIQNGIRRRLLLRQCFSLSMISNKLKQQQRMMMMTTKTLNYPRTLKHSPNLRDLNQVTSILCDIPRSSTRPCLIRFWLKHSLNNSKATRSSLVIVWFKPWHCNTVDNLEAMAWMFSSPGMHYW